MSYIEEIYQKNLKITFEEKKRHMRYRVVHFNPNYLIFKDGSVYSLYFGGRWLKPFAQKNKNKTHWTYHMQFSKNRRMVYIARLLYFHFTRHNFADMNEMGLISYKNSDSNDLRLKNLFLTTQAEINKASRKIPKYRNAQVKIRDTEKNIKMINKFFDMGYTYKKIGFLYGCSEMSVHRFVKRNNLKRKKKLFTN